MTFHQLVSLPPIALIGMYLVAGAIYYAFITILICDTKPGLLFSVGCVTAWPLMLCLLIVLLVEEVLAVLGGLIWIKLKRKK
ncbi:hypothetical protein O3W44_22605 [Pantoea sp. LMR881]|uniref:hypothetical protein n=1 Tax=Pantoea sp. LMR881 TaxID=3014336 RepID=UPI0022AF2C3D|nr:hypothetical protein [Pantoea sp. LMR881]MCZ4061326.1 hypothetical protein [Pantoea sp. LMR881]